jgi:hypothetical protein
MSILLSAVARSPKGDPAEAKDLALQSQADGGIRTLDPALRASLGAETEGDGGTSEGINALQIRLF